MANQNICPICGDDGPDHRTLVLRNLYDLSEISEKLLYHDKKESSIHGFYSITTCKNCRADFMKMLGEWIAGKYLSSEAKEDACIPVRQLGTTVMMTENEYEDFKKEADK